MSGNSDERTSDPTPGPSAQIHTINNGPSQNNQGNVECTFTQNVLVNQKEAPVTKLPGCSEPPTNFSGRSKFLFDLHKLVDHELQQPRRGTLSRLFVITGLGGIGKSSVARKYAKDYKDEYFNGNVAWINAETEQSATSSFRELAAQLKVDNWKELCSAKMKEHDTDPLVTFHRLVDGVYAHLNTHSAAFKQALFIFDNAQQLGKGEAEFEFGLTHCLPKKDFEFLPVFLVTSRTRYWGVPSDKIKTRPLEKLTRNETKDFICTTFSISKEDAKRGPGDEEKKNRILNQLCDIFDGFPLGLKLATAVISADWSETTTFRRKIQGVENYIREFNQNVPEWAEREIPDTVEMDHQLIMKNIWEITIKRIKSYGKGGARAVKLLQLCAFLPTDSISCRLLHVMYNNTCISRSNIMNLTETTAPETISALRLLEKFSMVELTTMDEGLTENTGSARLSVDMETVIAALKLASAAAKSGLFAREAAFYAIKAGSGVGTELSAAMDMAVAEGKTASADMERRSALELLGKFFEVQVFDMKDENSAGMSFKPFEFLYLEGCGKIRIHHLVQKMVRTKLIQKGKIEQNLNSDCFRPPSAILLSVFENIHMINGTRYTSSMWDRYRKWPNSSVRDCLAFLTRMQKICHHVSASKDIYHFLLDKLKNVKSGDDDKFKMLCQILMIYQQSYIIFNKMRKSLSVPMYRFSVCTEDSFRDSSLFMSLHGLVNRAQKDLENQWLQAETVKKIYPVLKQNVINFEQSEFTDRLVVWLRQYHTEVLWKPKRIPPEFEYQETLEHRFKTMQTTSEKIFELAAPFLPMDEAIKILIKTLEVSTDEQQQLGFNSWRYFDRSLLHVRGIPWDLWEACEDNTDTLRKSLVENTSFLKTLVKRFEIFVKNLEDQTELRSNFDEDKKQAVKKLDTNSSIPCNTIYLLILLAHVDEPTRDVLTSHPNLPLLLKRVLWCLIEKRDEKFDTRLPYMLVAWLALVPRLGTTELDLKPIAKLTEEEAMGFIKVLGNGAKLLPKHGRSDDGRASHYQCAGHTTFFPIHQG